MVFGGGALGRYLGLDEVTGVGSAWWDSCLYRKNKGIPVVSQQVMNLACIREDTGSVPDLLSGLRIQCCHELWCR